MTSTDLAVRNGSALAITSEQTEFTPQQIAALRHIGLEGASEGDLRVFFHQSQRTGLDPFAKQIYMIGRTSQNQRTKQWEIKYTIQTGIDGYRLIARRVADQRREDLGYEDENGAAWCGEDGVWRNVWLSSQHPAAARVVVLRNGQRFPAVAVWTEYVQTTKDGSPNSMWQRMGAGQLAKCAEALALRKAFPQDLSGIYTTEEMGQAENGHAAPRQQAARPPSIRDAINQTVTNWANGTGGPINDAVLSAAGDAGVLDHEEIEQSEAEARRSRLRTDAQAKKLAVLMRELGMDNRDQALAYFSSIIGRGLESTKELTKAEASKVIDALASAKDTGADPQTGEIVDAEVVDWPEPAPVGGAA